MVSCAIPGPGRTRLLAIPTRRSLFQPRLRFLGPESAHPARGCWAQAKSRLPPPILPIPPPPPSGRAGKPVGSRLPASRVLSRGARGCGAAQRPKGPRGATPHLPRTRPALRCAGSDLVPHLRVSEPQPARHAPGAAPRPRP